MSTPGPDSPAISGTSAWRGAAVAAHEASRRLATLPTDAKNAFLHALAAAIRAGIPAILEANGVDLDAARKSGLAPSKVQRLGLTGESISRLCDGLSQVASLPDPVGQVTRETTVPSGLRVRKVRVPLGVICMIYEARPAVTIDAFALCFTSGNACLLKGGREAFATSSALAAIAHAALAAHSLPRAALTLVNTSDRDELKSLLQLDDLIDLVIPRGGEDLIRFVAANSRIPTIQHFKGVCHIYVDESADVSRAIDLCVSAKTSAPATCNAAECVLVHRAVAPSFLPMLDKAMKAAGVECRADTKTLSLMPSAIAAADSDFGREFLDLILAVKVVENVGEAIDHIRRYGSRHTESILSADPNSIAAFRAGVDASCVMVNASTRFNDGFELGLGAEIGISTTKLHAYGPMGLEDLTTQRFEVVGKYHTR